MAASADQLAAEQAAMKKRQMDARRQQAWKTRRENQMQASVTTLNINGPITESGSAEPPQPAPETVSVPVSFLADLQKQIDELKTVKEATGVAGAAGMSYEQLLFLLAEMKKPDADTQAKIDAAKERERLNRENMIELTMLEESERIARQTNCPHRKENQRTAYVLANERNGMFTYLCQHCQKVTEPTRTPPDQFGVQIGGSFQFA